MADKTHVSRYDGTMVKVGDRYRRVDKGAAVPPGADPEHLAVLLERGMVAEDEPTAGFAADPDAPPPFRVAPDDVDGAGPIPAKSANKDAWVEYAVSQGTDRAEAEALTKDQLIERFGG